MDLFNDIQGAITRLISTSLRHGAEIQFVVQQLEKSDGSIIIYNIANRDYLQIDLIRMLINFTLF